ncbi:MAG TPA: hypothetical protein VE465_01700 [Streptosporangiaceae bacterium]|nr:hypothetical protein [Streptosporangiaceae bacterium]
MMTFRPATAWLAGLVCAGALVGAARPAAAECECWRYVRTGDTGADTTLGDVAAPGPTVAWATGSRGNRPMVMTWTGTRWRETAVGFPTGTLIEGIAATSPRDAWVVGYNDGTPEIARWTGRRWAHVPMPTTGPTFPRAVDARTSADVWIVGSRDGFAGTQAGIWHWDGRSWTAVPLDDDVGMNSEFVAVSAYGARDAWAVGTGGTTPPRQLLFHWNGKDWTAAPAPKPPGESELTDVTMVSSDNVWAVGGTTAPAAARPAASRMSRPAAAPPIRANTLRTARPVQPPPRDSRPLAEHWDGRAWRVMPTPAIDGEFYSVAGDGASGIWAAGQRADGSALLAHWDGHRWDISRPPTPDGRGPAAVWAITQVRGTSYLWAVGPVEGPMYQAMTWTNAPRPG